MWKVSSEPWLPHLSERARADPAWKGRNQSGNSFCSKEPGTRKSCTNDGISHDKHIRVCCSPEHTEFVFSRHRAPPPAASGRCAPSGLCCPFSHPRPQMRISWGRGPWVRPGNKRRGSRFMSTYCVPGTVHSLCHCERCDSPFHGEQTEPWAGTSLYPSSVQLFSLRLRPQLSQHPEGRESGAEQLSGKGC